MKFEMRKGNALIVWVGFFCGVVLLLLQTASAQVTTYVWTNTAGGNWSVAANWSPNGVPGTGNAVQITNAGTYTVTNNVTTTTNLNGVFVGGAASGVQTLQMPNLINLSALNTQINSNGIISLLNSIFSGPISVANGAVLKASGATFQSQITVENGGAMVLAGTPTYIGNDDVSPNTNNWLLLQSGAQMNTSTGVYLFAPMTNSGTCNITNTFIELYNDNTVDEDGWLVNLNVINLIGSGDITAIYSDGYMLNAGTINATNGTYIINVGGSPLTGIYNSAPGSTVQFGASTSPGTSLGAGFTLNGGGNFTFTSGLLTLTNNTIPNLQLTGGVLELGASFQGGAITNLTLDGITLSNTLPVTGTLVSSNNSTVVGSLTVNNGAVFTSYGVFMDGQVTVASGGLMQLMDTSYLGNNGYSGNTNCYLLLQSGAQLDAAVGAWLYLYAPMTNSGTCYATNMNFEIYNNGTVAQDGALVNTAGGIINLVNSASILTQTASSTFLNQGTIDVTNGNSVINVGSGLMAGAYNVAAGSIIDFGTLFAGGTSAGANLTLGGSGRSQFFSGLLTLPSNTIPNLVLTSGTLALGTNFQGGAITNLTLNGISLSNTLPVTGPFFVTNTTLTGSFTVSNGAVFGLNNSIIEAQVTVASGGDMVLFGSASIVGNNGFSGNTNWWLWLQSGAQLTANVSLDLFAPMTNSGTCTLTGSGFAIFNNNTSGEDGWLVNLSGGQIFLVNSSFINTEGTAGYLSNQGTINVISGLSYIEVGSSVLTGTYNVSPGATNEFQANNNPGTSLGAGLTLSGSGQYLFNSGLLTLTNNTISNLALTGGTLALGPSFQGGGITNLGLVGVTLTNNTLPVTGSFAATNCMIYGSFAVSNGAVFTVNSVTMKAQVTVQSGGEMLALGFGNSLGVNGFNTNYFLSVQSGGVLNATGTNFFLSAPMTNSGTCNITNEQFYIETAASENGALVNLTNGVINLIDTAGVTGGTPAAYLINHGTINVFSTNSTSIINVNNFTNTATLSAQHGTLELEGSILSLQPSETLNVALNSATDFGCITLNNGSNVDLSQIGIFLITLNGGYMPPTNQNFQVLTYPSYTNGFAPTNFQSTIGFQALYNATNLTIHAFPQNAATIQFSANPTSGIVPLTVNFTSPSSDSANNAITSWSWNFGDGVGTSTNQNPTYIYTNVGNFSPSLTVTNANNLAIAATGPSITVTPQYSFTPTIGSLNTGRMYHTATLLPNGLVLVAGGQDASDNFLSSAELYNPATGKWTATGSMNNARYLHTATLLTNGMVLVAGGVGGVLFSSVFQTSSELYNPATGTWTTTTGPLNTARYYQTATLLTNGMVLVAGGLNSSGVVAGSELYNPATGTWTPTAGPLNTGRYEDTATLLPNGFVLVTAGATLSGIPSAELFNPATGMWTTTTNAPNISRRQHSATLLPNGQVLVAGGVGTNGFALASVELFNPATGTWTVTNSMNTARYEHTANLLPDGLVIVAGGDGSNILSSVELFNPATGTWTTTTGALNTARFIHTATMLPNGQVLIAGGDNGGALASSELAAPSTNPPTGTWATTSSMNIPRNYQTASLLPDGRVLVAGGYNGGSIFIAELFNPATGTWANTGSMNTTRGAHTATLLPNGQVLVASGESAAGFLLNSAELFNPATGMWTNTGSLNIARVYFTTTLLANGQVLVTGGFQGGALSSAELYNPATGTWTATNSMNTARDGHTATLLTNGLVLVAGGNNSVPVSSAELYNPATGTWTATNSMNTARSGHTATLLPNGKVLVAGGADVNGNSLTSAELYDPATGTWTTANSLNIARNSHTAALLLNGQVLVVGGVGTSGNPLASVELYNPATGTWTLSGSLNIARYESTTTVLTNGQVLVAGGYHNGAISNAELYNVDLGFNASWQPQITSVSSPLTPGGTLVITGSMFRGISEGSGGNGAQDSSADYPVVQLFSLASGQTMSLLTTNWSANSYTSAPVTNFPFGYAMVTVCVNGIPSVANIINVGFPSGSPTVQYNASATNGPAPLMVNFTSPSSDSGGNPITSWNWSFGDGVGFSTNQNPSYTYMNAGLFAPSLTVTNANNLAIAATGPSITVAASPTVQYTASPASGTTPLTVNFTSPGSDSASNAIISWNWSFGDGVGFSTNQNPSYTYTTAGHFIPSLTVTNTHGLAIVATGPSITAALPPVGVFITSPTNGASFTTGQTVTFTATAYSTNGILGIALYTNSVLVMTNAATNISANLTDLPAGGYQLMAVSTDSNNVVATAVVYITVNVPGTVLITFDPLDTSGNTIVSGGALTAYAAQFGVVGTNNSRGTTVVVENQADVAGGGFVAASSQPNVLTQIGSNGPVSFTVKFTPPLTQFSFTRPELLASNTFVTHPAWQVQAFDSVGVLLAVTNAAQISSSSNVPAQTYTLTGAGIASIEFDSQGSGLNTFNAMLLDDFLLTPGLASNVPPSVVITSPTNGQVFTSSAAIPINAQAVAGIGTVTGVGFYFNGILAGSSVSSPFSILWNAPSNGVYALTAIATNSAGLTRTSAAISVTVASGFAIATPPVSQTIAVGGAATFSVTTTGTNVTYQWQFNGANISGATHSSYTVTNASLSAAGNYTAVITSQGQSITSQPAVLTVLGPPTLGSIAIATNNNGTITLSVSANDSVPYYYQWQLNGSSIPGAMNSGLTGTTPISYTLNAEPFNSGNYQVVVANAVASQESPVFPVAVNFTNLTTTNDNFASSLTIVSLTNNGDGVSGINNSKISFPPSSGPAQIAGKPVAGFLWYNWTATFTGVISLTTRGSSFDTLLGVYTGNTLNNLTTVAEDDDSGGFFTSLVIFNCVQGTTYHIAVAGYQGASGNVDLELSPGPAGGFPGPTNGYTIGGPVPVITEQPVNQIVPAGATVTLKVMASSATGYQCQWFYTTVPVAGGINSNLVISNFLGSAAGNYFVQVSNSVGAVQSAVANIQVAAVTQNGQTGTTSNLLDDKFGDAVDLTGGTVQDRFRPQDAGGETGGFTLSQSFSTVGAGKEEGEPNHAGQPGGASYWYTYTAPGGGTLRFDTSGSTFNTILAVYTNKGPVVSFSTLGNVGAAYATNFAAQGQPVVTVSNVVGGNKFFIAIDGYLGASGTASLNVALTPLPLSTNAVTNSQTIVAITSPANYSLSASSNITVHGTIKGNGANRPAFTSMQVSVNGGAPVALVQFSTNSTPIFVQTAGGLVEEVQQTINWSLPNVALVPGANIITAQTFDVVSTFLETVSLPATRTIFYDDTPPSPLIKAPVTLLATGPGKITGQVSNARLEIGKIYTIKAVPRGNGLFANWASGTNTNSLTALTGGATLAFDMSTNLILQANFVTNPFPAVGGVYNGLFSPASGITEASSGFLTATLPAAGHGTYSAKVLVDGGTYPFSGTFDLDGDTEQTVARSGKPPLTVNLHVNLNLPAPDDQLTGSVNNYASNGWNSELIADRAVFKASAPAIPYDGKYTMVIPPGGTTNEPGGSSYATLNVAPAGTVAISGSLADKTAFSQSVPVSKDGNIPLYVSLYTHKGSLQGWLSVTNGIPAAPPLVLGTAVAWIKTNFNTPFYGGGFTNTNLTAYGSLYNAHPPVFTLTGGTLTISNGNLGAPQTYTNLSLHGNDLINSESQVLGVITPASGILTVKFPPGNGPKTTAKGVLIQDDTNAAGWFFGTSESGSFLLQP